MGGIDIISLNLIEGSIYHGTWQGQWLVRGTGARQYVTTIVATNTLGKSSATDVLWRDPQTYERYHNEFYGSVTTTNTTWQDALSITFTPNVAGPFQMLARADISNSSTSTYTDIRVIYDTTTFNETRFTPSVANEVSNFGSFDIFSCNVTAYTFKMQYKTGDAAGTANVTNPGINVFAVSDFHHVDSTAENSTLLETYQDKVTLTDNFTAGDHLVLVSMEVAGSDTARQYLTQLTYDGASWGEIARAPSVVNEHALYTVARSANLTAGEHTFGIQYMSWAGPGESTTFIRNARICVTLLSDLGDAEYIESEAVDSTTSTTYVTKPGATLNFDPATYLNGFRLLWGLLGGSSASKYTYGSIWEDAAMIGESSILPNDKDDYVPLWSGFHRFHNSANWTLELKHKTQQGGTSYAKNVRLMVIRMDTLTPFSDSGHTTYSDNFTSLGDTVYIQGCFFSILDAYNDFHVAYYDGNGSQRKSEGISADANGVVNSWCTFSDYPLAAAGTWHAVIYMDPLPPSDNYTASDNTSIREVAFNVEAGAIPEFPTIFAGIGVAALCFAIYYWMRKRRLLRDKA